VQAVATARPVPVHAEQAAQGATPEADQVEPATQAAGAHPEMVDSAQPQLPPEEHVAVWPAGQLAGGVFGQAVQVPTYPPIE